MDSGTKFGHRAVGFLAVAGFLLFGACGKAEEAVRPTVGNEDDWAGVYQRRLTERELSLDFIFVSIDTLRADHLPFYGYQRATTGSPKHKYSLSWLAEQSLIYDTCWAPIGKTLPSLASFWTGEFPLVHGGISNPTIVQSASFAQRFQDDGYHSFAAVANQALIPALGLAQGFKEYGIRFKTQEKEIPDLLLTSARPVITAKQPLMLWAHFMTPHQPYVPPPDFAQSYNHRTEPIADNAFLFGLHSDPKKLSADLKQYCIDLYDAEILTANSHVERLLGGLDQAYRKAGRGPLLENAIVVFFADHGEELAERHGYFMHAKSLYSGVLRVPFMIAGPGVGAGRIAEPIALTNIMPILVDKQNPQRASFPASWQTQFYAWRTDRWTLIHNPGDSQMGPFEPPKTVAYPYPVVALYDRNSDPGETTNVAAQHPDVVRDLLDAQSKWFVGLDRKEPKFLKGQDPKTQAQNLVDLGYLDEVPKTFVPPMQASQWKE